jgi:hypothetical protein
MSSLNVNVSGFPELQAKIKALANDKDKRREMLLILRQVAKPTLDASRQTVPVSKKPHIGKYGQKIQPGNLKKSLGLIQGRKGQAKDNPTIYVGARVKGSFDGWYAHFVHERVNRYKKGYKRIRKKGANESAAIAVRVSRNPFLTKAYTQTQGRVTADAEKRMATFIQRRINRLS